MTLAGLAYTALVGVVVLCSCKTATDPRSGFELPDTTANARDDQGEEIDADWSCLGTPSDHVPTTVEVSLSGWVYELASFEPVADVAVSGFSGGDWQNPFDSDVSDAEGAYALTVPVGTGRFGIETSGQGLLSGFRLEIDVEPDAEEQEVDLDAVSLAKAAEMTAIVGMKRSPGRGVVLGGFHDCQGRNVAGAIATVSTAPGEPLHADGVSSYYFGANVLPATPNQQPYTNFTGMFLVVDLPPATSTNWLQAWGFVSEEDLQAGVLTLLAEEQIPMVADSAISIGLEPLRTHWVSTLATDLVPAARE